MMHGSVEASGARASVPLFLSRHELATSPDAAVQRVCPQALDQVQVAVLAGQVTVASVNHCASQSFEMRVVSDDRCGFGYFLDAQGLCDDSSTITPLFPDCTFVYSGGCHDFTMPRGTRLLSIGINGPPPALAKLLGLGTEELSHYIKVGAAKSGTLTRPMSATTEKLRRSARRVVESISVEQRDSLRLLRAKAAALDFGLYLLEMLDDSMRGSGIDRERASSVRRRLETAARELDGSPRNDRSIDEIAAHLGFSRSGFDHAFRAQFGTSPADFRIDNRLRTVAHLLATTDAPITSLAMEFAFSSSSNLARCFRTRYGLTPSEYRIRHRGVGGADWRK